MNRKTRLNRLRKLRHIMLNHDRVFVPGNKDNANGKVLFDINTWGEELTRQRARVSHCNTAACALGSAGLYKPFRRAGLKTDPSMCMAVTYREPGARASFRELGFSAGEKFFGISRYESQFLFDPLYYYARQKPFMPQGLAAKALFIPGTGNGFRPRHKVLPKHVAARVAQLIKHYSKHDEPLAL